MALAGKICLVTGASRGIGRGIAIQLGQAGATVYITGRTLKAADSGSCLEEVQREIEKRNGRCIPVVCDHSKDDQVKAVFDKISSEQDGRLDILVNNAYSAVSALFDSMNVPFWEQPLTMWDDVNCVGLRNHYYCSIYGARLMVPRRQGLIVNISSFGGLKYLFNVPYGVGKEALDRMAADCGHELRKENVTVVSLWPGAVKTEFIVDNVLSVPDNPAKALFEKGESTEFSGKCIVSLATDPKRMQKTGKVLMTAELAREYGIVDINGSVPSSMRSMKTLLSNSGYHKMASITPGFIKLPYWFLSLGGNKL